MESWRSILSGLKPSNVLHINFSLLMRPVCSRTNSTPLEAYSPAAITVLEAFQTHKQSLSNQATNHSWVERVHIQVKCLAQALRPHCQDLNQRPLNPNSWAVSTRAWHPACKECIFWGHWEWSLPGSMSSSVVLLHPGQSQSDGTTLYVPAWAMRDTVSNVEGQDQDKPPQASHTRQNPRNMALQSRHGCLNAMAPCMHRVSQCQAVSDDYKTAMQSNSWLYLCIIM